MRFQALMVSVDDASAELLAEAFADLNIDHERCSASEAVSKLEETHFDLVVANFDDLGSSEQLLGSLRQSSLSKTAVALALLADPSKVAQAFGAGANFVLYSPLAEDNMRATLRAVSALMQRERRRQFRVPVQMPVTLECDSSPELEGIMLDLSEGGMDVLAAKPLERGEIVEVKFSLPDLPDMRVRAQVMWANANGQSGLQFLNFTENQTRVLSSWLGSNAPQLPPEDPAPLTEYKLSDLSLGGCYIETLAPFPKGAKIDVCMRVGDFEVHLDGAVRVVYPGHGMGVEFTASSEQRELVMSLIHHLSTQVGVTPDVLVWPKAINFKQLLPSSSCASTDTEDALVQLLSAGAALTQDEFLSQLRSQRTSHAEATTV